ncbi:MAG: Uma2 family endonuclease [Planctomycetes bacterium]|nr:Uma2 family endonuclease [Planctomycetota bacterium]
MTTTTTIATRKLPRAKRWTYTDYCKIPADLERHEILAGEHFVTPAPDISHQDALGGLYVQFHDRLVRPGHGRVMLAPCDVVLAEDTVVQPDLVVVLAERTAIIRSKAIHGTPDLLIEILSPSSDAHDRKRKRAIYAAAGVREYWIVDTRRRRIERLTLVNGGYGRASIHSRRIRAHVLPVLQIELDQIWNAGRPS